MRFAGLSQREAAEHLGGSTGAAMSAQIKLLNESEKRDRKIARKLTKFETKIGEEIREVESVEVENLILEG